MNPRPGRPSLSGYPANFLVAGRRCVVVGAGRIAARKLTGLLDAGADIVVVAPEAVDQIQSLAAAGRIVWHARDFVPEDLDAAWSTPAARFDVCRRCANFHPPHLG